MSKRGMSKPRMSTRAAMRCAVAMASATCGELTMSAAAAAAATARSCASLTESADCAPAGAAAHAAARANVSVRLFMVISLRSISLRAKGGGGRAALDGVLLARAHLRGHHPDLEEELLRVDAAPHRVE